jgi:starch synthase
MSSHNTSVTVSVWNDFWSPQLVAGLESAGFPVIHHTTGRQKASCARFVRNLPAAALNHLVYRKLLPSSSAYRYSRKLIDWSGAQFTHQTDVFWGWSGCSLLGLRKAKAAGKLAILERGSTHCLWHRDRMRAVYRELGLPLHELPSDHELAYDLQEYEVADVICVPSRFVFNSFIEKGIPDGKLHLNPYGVDFDFWSATKRRALGSRPFTLLWVAALMPRKGITVLLEAWRKSGLRDAKLVLVGGAAASIGHVLKDLPEGVQHKSHLSHADIRSEMSCADAYILPSYEEGMARSVLEAAAAGLPVIITKETGATDILLDSRDGWIVPSGDVERLSEALRQVAMNPLTASQRGASAQAAVKPFTWDAYGARAAEFLRTRLSK